MATASPCTFIMQQPAQIIWFGVTVTQHPKLPRPVFALQKNAATPVMALVLSCRATLAGLASWMVRACRSGNNVWQNLATQLGDFVF